MYLVTYTVCIKTTDEKKLEKEIKNLKNVCVETFSGEITDNGKTFMELKIAMPEDTKDYKVDPEEIISKYDENFEHDCLDNY